MLEAGGKSIVRAIHIYTTEESKASSRAISTSFCRHAGQQASCSVGVVVSKSAVIRPSKGLSTVEWNSGTFHAFYSLTNLLKTLQKSGILNIEYDQTEPAPLVQNLCAPKAPGGALRSRHKIAKTPRALPPPEHAQAAGRVKMPLARCRSIPLDRFTPV